MGEESFAHDLKTTHTLKNTDTAG